MKTLLGSVALLLALTSCSSSDGDNKNPNEDGGPTSESASCADIWVAGNTLPSDYDGCEISADLLEAAAVSECADGSKWTGYDDRFYAKLGGKIHEVTGEMADDRAYKLFVDECQGVEQSSAADENPTAVVERWLSAYEDADVATACSLQTERYTKGEAALAAADGWGEADATCPEFVATVSQLLGAGGLGEYDVSQVRASGRSALVAAAFSDSSDSRYRLLKVDGQWLVDEELHPELK